MKILLFRTWQQDRKKKVISKSTYYLIYRKPYKLTVPLGCSIAKEHISGFVLYKSKICKEFAVIQEHFSDWLHFSPAEIQCLEAAYVVIFTASILYCLSLARKICILKNYYGYIQ